MSQQSLSHLRPCGIMCTDKKYALLHNVLLFSPQMLSRTPLLNPFCRNIVYIIEKIISRSKSSYPAYCTIKVRSCRYKARKDEFYWSRQLKKYGKNSIQDSNSL